MAPPSATTPRLEVQESRQTHRSWGLAAPSATTPMTSNSSFLPLLTSLGERHDWWKGTANAPSSGGLSPAPMWPTAPGASRSAGRNLARVSYFELTHWAAEAATLNQARHDHGARLVGEVQQVHAAVVQALPGAAVAKGAQHIAERRPRLGQCRCSRRLPKLQVKDNHLVQHEARLRWGTGLN